MFEQKSSIESFDLQRYLPYLLNRAAIRITEAFSRELRQFDLTVVMWRVLAVLWHDGSMWLTELAAATTIEVSTLSRLITTMQSRGLVGRAKSPEDARAVVVDLTEAGRAMTEKIIPTALRYEAAAVDHISDQDRDLLRRLLIQLYGNIGVLEPKPEEGDPAF